jgi:hypothetical protein
MVHHENGAGPELSPNFGDGAAMKQTDTERLEKLAEAWRIVRNPSSKGHWVRLAALWTTLAKEAKATSRWTELASQ